MEENQIDREWMVEQQIARRGIYDERVLDAMRKVPRHLFIPPEARQQAYSDRPLRIGSGQTISQPYIVGLMTALLEVQSEHKVLDVGTGSGYQAAILAELAKEIHTIERYPELARSAEKVLHELGYGNVHVHVGDGTQGYTPCAPYDRIIVGAAAPSVPKPLLNQLVIGGRLVIPVGKRYSQRLEIWENAEDGLTHSSNIPVVFVPLVGENGWDAD
jgi:protein-L-isoaspartate(D-aspartate) O-methyltransferase